MNNNIHEDYNENKPRAFHTSEGYARSKRATIFFIGLFWLSAITGIEYNSDSTVSIFSLRLKDAQYIPEILLCAALYNLFQCWINWSSEDYSVRKFLYNKIDVFFVFFISIITLIHYVTNNNDIIEFVENSDFVIFTVLSSNSLIALLGAYILIKSSNLFKKKVEKKYRDEGLRILDILMNNNWILWFNPSSDSPNYKKKISFDMNGNISDGSNDNEYKWRINNEYLEILNKNGDVYSRFYFDEKTKSFKHTNDSDTKSLKNQIIQTVE